MARIYRLTDRIKYKIGEVEIQISPLSVHDKATLHSYLKKTQAGDDKAIVDCSVKAIKYAVKAISGVENADGTPYELQFEGNSNHLTDECVEDLMNLSESPNMIVLCSQLVAGIPNELPKGISLVEDNSRPNELKSQKLSK